MSSKYDTQLCTNRLIPIRNVFGCQFHFLHVLDKQMVQTLSSITPTPIISYAYITLTTSTHHSTSCPCLPCGLFISATYFTQITQYLTNAFENFSNFTSMQALAVPIATTNQGPSHLHLLYITPSHEFLHSIYRLAYDRLHWHWPRIHQPLLEP